MSTTIDPAAENATKKLSDLLTSGTLHQIAAEVRDGTLEALADEDVETIIEDLKSELGGHLLTETERADVTADLAVMRTEADRRELITKADDDDGPACVYCGCTELAACDPPCAWLQLEPVPVCDAPACLEKHEAELKLVDAAIDLANPPIADVESSVQAEQYVSSAQITNDDVGEWAGAPVGMILEIPLEDIAPDPAQARDEGADDSIGDTLKPTDILPAIELRVHPFAGSGPKYPPYMIIDGERRWRGSIKAGRTTIRAWVNPNPGDDGDRLLRQAVLNEGRRLKPMEEARTWARIRAAKGWNIQQLAEAVGRPKSTVSDRLALLNAPAPFQPLIASGVLPAAAAPIMRRYSDVPERIVTALVKEISKAELSDFIATQTPIPLAQFENALRHSTYAAGLRNVTHSKDVAKSYEGEMVTIDGQRYATDAKAWDAHSAAHWKRQTSSDSADRAPSKADKERQQREAAERKRQQLKLQTRRAQFHAISAKLPTSIGGSANGADWSQLLVDLVMQEVHQDTLRVLAAQLKLTGEKSRTGGMSHYGDMVKRHAKTLSSQGRVKLAMQLLLAPDINIPAYIARGPERFAAAAKLAKLDLSKIKPPADEKAKKAPAKPSAKKRR